MTVSSDMTVSSWKRLLTLATAVLLAAGCSAGKHDSGASQNAQGQGNGPPIMGDAGEGGGSPLKKAMSRIGKGPKSLSASLDGELNANPPPWDTIQAQAKEYDQLAAPLAKENPPHGGKESWEKLMAAFAADAADLDKEAQAKDLAGTKEALTKLNGSCKACHQEHRMGPKPRS